MPVSSPRPIPILMYHQIARPSPRGTPYRSLSVAPGTFARHMRWLKALGYRGLSMRDLAPYLAGERTGKVFGLTFDDGFRNVHRHALPVLQSLGFTATNYFVAGHLGGHNFWDASEGVPSAPLMDAQELRDWVAAGNEAGSHTIDHVDLPALPPDEAVTQLSRSRTMLAALSGAPCEAFCYPYGHYDANHVHLVRKAGYTSATTTDRGRAQPGASLFELPRVPVLRTTSFLLLLQKLTTNYEDKRGAGHTR
ncbi:polysaccharide deacetylase family protein [Pusillimonas sp. TS35]|uniref:polysaccharide deacetylase family protein n=1 Tax=Paracandidimonas lactea TaxID=2895524 RepID=UPI001424D5FA|nr:polysaccharide deacetylase family protein [Paracandidimonas lactea]MYN13429.1 polysaccharide deacetylase family protein [Pusillimonas sp. TS35]